MVLLVVFGWRCRCFLDPRWLCHGLGGSARGWDQPKTGGNAIPRPGYGTTARATESRPSLAAAAMVQLHSYSAVAIPHHCH